MNGVKCPHCGAYTVNEPTQAQRPNDSYPYRLLITDWDMHRQM